LNKNDIETRLNEYLGVDRIIWFHHGQLLGDDTDGHIDTLIRFADPETIFYAASDDRNDPNFESLRQMSEEVKLLKQKNGKPYQLVPLPSPVIKNNDGDYLPASYANFLIINNAVLVPMYGVKTDDQIIKTFSEYFVDRRVIAINCRPLIEQYGSLHCITMHLPEGVVI
jgi:agmatine/peptidylarginine deiminase